MTPNPEYFAPRPSANRLPIHRWRTSERLLSDDALRRFEVLLDEAFRVPGLGMRFGIDGIIGLVPGLGDVLAGILSLVIPVAAWIRGVPYVTLARMAANLAIGVAVGAIPIAGDAFVILWKVNRRNYLLMARHLGEPRRHTRSDWAFLLLLVLGLLAAFALPVIVLVWMLAWMFQHAGA
jgi:hypothetical protein